MCPTCWGEKKNKKKNKPLHTLWSTHTQTNTDTDATKQQQLERRSDDNYCSRAVAAWRKCLWTADERRGYWSGCISKSPRRRELEKTPSKLAAKQRDGGTEGGVRKLKPLEWNLVSGGKSLWRGQIELEKLQKKRQFFFQDSSQLRRLQMPRPQCASIMAPLNSHSNEMSRFKKISHHTQRKIWILSLNGCCSRGNLSLWEAKQDSHRKSVVSILSRDVGLLAVFKADSKQGALSQDICHEKGASANSGGARWCAISIIHPLWPTQMPSECLWFPFVVGSKEEDVSALQRDNNNLSHGANNIYERFLFILLFKGAHLSLFNQADLILELLLSSY